MEQFWIDFLYDIFHIYVQIFIYFWFISMFLTPKYNRFVITLLPVILVIFKPVQYLVVGNLYSFVVLTALMIIYAIVLHKDKTVVCIAAVFAVHIMVFISVLLPVIITYSVLEYIPSEISPHTWVSVFFLIFLDFFIFIGMTFGLLVWEKLMKRRNVKSFAIFLTFPISQMFFFVILVSFLPDNGNILINIYFMVGAALSIIADVFLVIALNQNSSFQDVKLRMNELEQELQFQLEYYERLSEQYSMIREYRHDINNLVETAKTLAKYENETEKLVNEISARAENISLPVYCSNPLVNAVIWRKSHDAGRYGINIATNIAVSDYEGIERLDLCSALVNLLDNAIDGTGYGGNVSLSISEKAGILFIETQNSVNEEKSVSKHRKTGGNHGNGLKILNKIAKKYNGSFVFENKDSTAHSVISFCVDK